MAIKTSIAVVLITGNTLMFIVHIGLVMLMAIDAAKRGIIRWVGMAIGATGPFVSVVTAVYGEILPIMVKR